MSDKPQLLGYSVDVDDDPHDDNDDANHIDVVTAEPERPSDTVLSASVGDAVASTAPVSSPTPQDSTQSSSTPPNQQEERKEHPTAAITTAATPTAPQLPVDEFADPKISGLHAIFPDYDASILHSIVDSVGGDQDRAVDALLAMSDPDHVPVQHAAANEQPSHAEQTQLDEEFARQLLLEDEQQYARDQIALRQQQQQEQMRQFPYAPRSHPSIYRGDAAQQQQQLPQRDTMSDMQEQFNRLAETGKRTFNTFVSKVKANFDQQRNAPDTSSSYGTGTSTGTGYVAQPPSPGLDRHAQQAYYAPRVSPNPQPGTINNNNDFENPPLVSSSVDRGSSASTPPPPATNSGPPVTNIDPGKIGLLPKRPVALVNTESQSSQAHDEDDEELEYLENPFEEGKYS